jgi:hypothetical protein
MVSELSGGENNIRSDQAPLMGIPFYKNADWATGTASTGSHHFQNDTALIAGQPNNIGYRKKRPAEDIAGLNNANAAVKIESQQPGSIQLNSTGDYAYRLFDVSGRLLTQGNLRKGWNQIGANSSLNGVLVLQWYGASGSGSQKIIQ